MLGILCSAFAIFLALLGMMYYYLNVEENDILQQNYLLVQVMTHEIESGYIKGIWPYKTLKMIGDTEEVAFLWIVKPDGEIFWTNDSAMMGQIVQDPFLGSATQLVRDSYFNEESIKIIANPLRIELHGAPWTLFLGISVQQLAKAQREIIAYSIAFFVIAIIFATIISLYLSGSFTKPLRKLMMGVQAIGQGDLDYQIDIKSRDEIGELAAAFNKTAVKLKETRERDKLINKMKSEFISLAAHQLRTPLSAIKWGLSLIQQSSFDKAEQSEIYQKINTSNEQMITLVNSLLNVTRIEEGKYFYNFSASQLTETVQRAIDGLQIEADKRKVKVDFKKPLHPLPLLQLDQEKLQIAIANVIENAIKYSLSGSLVEIKLTHRQSDILLTVKDQGIGIIPADRKRICEKFFRGTNAMRVVTYGTGLGLYLTKNIVEQHGGKISFKSRSNLGTAFYLTVPLRQPRSKTA